MIDIVEFRKKSEEDLKKELSKLEKDIQKVISDTLQKKEKNVRKARSLRKDIARIKTLIKEKTMEDLVKKEEK